MAKWVLTKVIHLRGRLNADQIKFAELKQNEPWVFSVELSPCGTILTIKSDAHESMVWAHEQGFIPHLYDWNDCIRNWRMFNKTMAAHAANLPAAYYKSKRLYWHLEY